MTDHNISVAHCQVEWQDHICECKINRTLQVHSNIQTRYELYIRTSRMHVRLIELCTGPLDVFLHEQQLLQTSEFLRICRPRQGAAQVINGKPGLLAAS